MSERHIYIICFEDGYGGFRGPVKVGISTDVQKRLRSLQTANAYPLTVAASYFCPGGLAELVEQCIHETEKDRALMGEWLDISPREAVQLVGLAARVILRAGFKTTAAEEADLIPWMGLDYTGSDIQPEGETCH